MTISNVMVVGAAGQTSTVTLQNNASTSAVSLAGKKYEFYKIFDVTVSGENVEHTVDADFYGYFTGKKADGKGDEFEFPESTAEDYSYEVAEYIKTFSTSSNMTTLVTDLREYVNTWITGADYTTGVMGATTIDNQVIETVHISDIPYGYYLILDSDNNVSGSNNIVAPGMLIDVAESSITVHTKASTPVLDKYIWHDDEGSTGQWDVVGDHQSGQTVLYKVSSTVPTNYTGYDTYTYKITTQKAQGVDYNHDVKVYAYDTDSERFDDKANSLLFDGTLDEKTFTKNADGSWSYTEGYFTITYPMAAGAKDDYILSVDVIGLNASGQYLENDSIYLSYSGVANKNLGTTDDSESDSTTLTYSNNPYNSESTGTYDEVVYHHVFDILVFKTANNTTTPLAGATFALYRTDGTGDEAVTTQVYLERDDEQLVTGVTTYHATTAAGASDTVGVVVTEDTGKFLIYGLNDALTYTITELEAPAGFNKVAPMDFVITATYDITGETLTNIKTDNSAITAMDTDSLTVTIVNTSTTLLPSTGGMGTTIFVVLGAALMLGALVVLMVMKRKERDN